MSLRQVLAHKLTAAILVPLGAAVLLLVAWQYFGGSRRPAPAPPAYYSDDDGVTWFTDTPDKTTPFDHNGNPAVYATVGPGPDGNLRVKFLARHTAVARRAFEQARAKGERPEMVTPFLEFKKPQSPQTAWIPDNDPRSSEITSSAAPNESH